MSFSNRKEKFLALANLDYAGKTKKELQEISRKVLEEGMHGLCFSPYMEGQNPGDRISEDTALYPMDKIFFLYGR